MNILVCIYPQSQGLMFSFYFTTLIAQHCIVVYRRNLLKAYHLLCPLRSSLLLLSYRLSSSSVTMIPCFYLILWLCRRRKILSYYHYFSDEICRNHKETTKILNRHIFFVLFLIVCKFYFNCWYCCNYKYRIKFILEGYAQWAEQKAF